MRETKRIVIPTQWPARSLTWYYDHLIDWVGGGNKFHLDRRFDRSGVGYAYRFDRAVTLKNSELVVLYEVLGTKGLVLEKGKIVREINRSYYQATAYEFPVVLFRLPDGTPGLIHCPNNYNELEIEELLTGKPLTKRTGKAEDFFHSRLQISPDGAYLLSAGWVWHPLDFIQIFEISAVLQDASILDREGNVGWPQAAYEDVCEMHSACFGFSKDLFYWGGVDENRTVALLVRIELANRAAVSTTLLEAVPGTIFTMDEKYILGLYEFPKLFDITTGKVVASWPELKTGKQDSSIIHHLDPIPPCAIDVPARRFAVADESKITVIELG